MTIFVLIGGFPGRTARHRMVADHFLSHLSTPDLRVDKYFVRNSAAGALSCRLVSATAARHVSILGMRRRLIWGPDLVSSSIALIWMRRYWSGEIFWLHIISHSKSTFDRWLVLTTLAQDWPTFWLDELEAK